MNDTQETKQYKLYTALPTGEIVVLLSTDHQIPYLNDCCASQAAGVGVDLTNPASYDIWDDAALCWNVLKERHEFHNPANLSELSTHLDGYIPFDHATGRLRGVLSLLKFAQDNLYGRATFNTTLPLAGDEAAAKERITVLEGLLTKALGDLKSLPKDLGYDFTIIPDIENNLKK